MFVNRIDYCEDYKTKKTCFIFHFVQLLFPLIQRFLFMINIFCYGNANSLFMPSLNLIYHSNPYLLRFIVNLLYKETLFWPKQYIKCQEDLIRHELVYAIQLFHILLKNYLLVEALKRTTVILHPFLEKSHKHYIKQWNTVLQFFSTIYLFTFHIHYSCFEYRFVSINKDFTFSLTSFVRNFKEQHCLPDLRQILTNTVSDRKIINPVIWRVCYLAYLNE